MRNLPKNQLAKLGFLTDMRKKVVTSRLAMLQASLTQKDAQISELKAPVQNASTLEEAKANATWHEWRRQEILRLNTEQAMLRAHYIQVKGTLERATAEDEIIGDLLKTLKADYKLKDRRKAELSQSLHFLPNDISN